MPERYKTRVVSSELVSVVPGLSNVRKSTTAGRAKPRRVRELQGGVYDIFGRPVQLPLTDPDNLPVRPQVRLKWDLPHPLGPPHLPTSYDFVTQAQIRRNRRLIARQRPTDREFIDTNPEEGPNRYDVCLQGNGVENCSDDVSLDFDLTPPTPEPTPPTPEPTPPTPEPTPPTPEPTPADVNLRGIVNEGNQAVLSCNSFSGASYIWTRDGVTIGATSSSSFTDPNILDGTSQFCVEVISEELTGSGCITLSNTITEPPEPPEPDPEVNLSGLIINDRAVLSCNTIESATYVWTKDGSTIGTTSSPSFTDPDILSGSAQYCVNISSSSLTNDISECINLTNTVGIGFTGRINANGQAVLSCNTFDGASYTWTKDGSTIGTTSSPSFTDPNILLGSAQYCVNISISGLNLSGCINLTNVTNVNLVGRINADNQAVLSCNTFAGATYTWTKNGSTIGTTSSPTFTDPNILIGNAQYCVSISSSNLANDLSECITLTNALEWSVSLSAEQTGDGEVTLSWTVTDPTPATGFSITGGGIFGTLTESGSSRQRVIERLPFGELTFTIVATFTGGHTATDNVVVTVEDTRTIILQYDENQNSESYIWLEFGTYPSFSGIDSASVTIDGSPANFVMTTSGGSLVLTDIPANLVEQPNIIPINTVSVGSHIVEFTVVARGETYTTSGIVTLRSVTDIPDFILEASIERRNTSLPGSARYYARARLIFVETGNYEVEWEISVEGPSVSEGFEELMGNYKEHIGNDRGAGVLQPFSADEFLIVRIRMRASNIRGTSEWEERTVTFDPGSGR